jgi:hypothetical protein
VLYTNAVLYAYGSYRAANEFPLALFRTEDTQELSGGTVRASWSHAVVRRVQEPVVTQKNPGGKSEQQDHGNYPDESGACRAWQQQAAKINIVRPQLAPPMTKSKVVDQLPSPSFCPENQGRKNRQCEYKAEQVGVEGQVEQVKRQGMGENRVPPGVGAKR